MLRPCRLVSVLDHCSCFPRNVKVGVRRCRHTDCTTVSLSYSSVRAPCCIIVIYRPPFISAFRYWHCQRVYAWYVHKLSMFLLSVRYIPISVLSPVPTTTPRALPAAMFVPWKITQCQQRLIWRHRPEQLLVTVYMKSETMEMWHLCNAASRHLEYKASFTRTVNVTVFVPFKNGFNAVLWCCSHIMLIKGAAHKNGGIGSTWKRAFTTCMCTVHGPSIVTGPTTGLIECKYSRTTGLIECKYSRTTGLIECKYSRTTGLIECKYSRRKACSSCPG